MAEELTREQRFWAHVDVSEGCWAWAGARNSKGYGLYTPVRRGVFMAHRFAWESHVGPIPEGLQIDHLCRNRSCVRPDHLEPVTLQENIRRGAKSTATHCKYGHAYTSDNTRLAIRDGARTCRACNRAHHIRQAERKKRDRVEARL